MYYKPSVTVLRCFFTSLIWIEAQNGLRGFGTRRIPGLRLLSCIYQIWTHDYVPVAMAIRVTVTMGIGGYRFETWQTLSGSAGIACMRSVIGCSRNP